MPYSKKILKKLLLTGFLILFVLFSVFCIFHSIKADAASPERYLMSAENDVIEYVITGNGSSFTVAKNGETPSTISSDTAIQNAIDAIRTNAGGEDCIIVFGDGNELNIGTSKIIFSSGFGKITLKGKLIANSNYTLGHGCITIDGVFLESQADIIGESFSAVFALNNGGSLEITGGIISSPYDTIINNSTGTITISGGSVSSDNTAAIYVNNTGLLEISGDAEITSAFIGLNYGTIIITGGTLGDNILNMTGVLSRT